MLQEFKEKFTARLTAVSRIRKSHSDVPRHFRRLDSLARLLEGDSTCAAVYFDTTTEELWVATNKISSTSREKSGKIKYINEIFSLISNQDSSVKALKGKLAEVIYLNFTRGATRFGGSKLNQGINLKEFILEQIESLFTKTLATKLWREEAVTTLVGEEFFSEKRLLVQKISRYVRDFLKIRKFLMEKKSDPTAKRIWRALHERRFHVARVDGNDVHAEMRLMHRAKGYIGISKLCCDHCGLAVTALGIKTRGMHGQRNRWPVPSFFAKNDEHLRKYLGDECFEIYRQLTTGQKILALAFVSTEESNALNRKNKSEADSSDSDEEIGVDTSDEDVMAELDDSPLKNTWWYREIRQSDKEEFDRLRDMGVNISEIIRLYGVSPHKFHALSSPDAVALMQALSDSDAFEKLSEIFDEDEKLFWRLVNDEDELAIQYGLDEVCDRYHAKSRTNTDSCDDDWGDCDSYDEVGAELKSENGLDYTSDTENSENAEMYSDASVLSEETTSCSDDESMDGVPSRPRL